MLHVTMNGPVPPLDVLVQLCTATSRWLTGAGDRIVVAHGGEHNPEVVPFFFGCYLNWMGRCPHPKEGYLSVAGQLGLGEADLMPSQRRYLQYFELLQRGFTPQPLVLSRFAIAGLGGEDESDAQSITAELRQEGRLIKRFSPSDKDVFEADPVFELQQPVYGDITITLWDTYITDGVAIGSGQPLARVCFSTGFASAGDTLHFPLRELDAVPTIYKGLMPALHIRISLGLGDSKAALAVERLAFQVLLGVEGNQVNMSNAELEDLDCSSKLPDVAVDIEDLFDSNFDIVNDVGIRDLSHAKDASTANIEEVRTKLPSKCNLQEFFLELDEIAEI